MSKSIIRLTRGPFGDGSAAFARFAPFAKFVEGLDASQRDYLIEDCRRNEAELQMAIRDAAAALGTLNAQYDAAVQSLRYLESQGGR